MSRVSVAEQKTASTNKVNFNKSDRMETITRRISVGPRQNDDPLEQ